MTNFSSALMRQYLTTFLDGIRENIQYGDSILPPDASIRDAHAILEALLAFFGNLLVA